MRILLIEPPPLSKKGNLRVLGSSGTLKTDMCWPPLDLMIISGALKENGIDSDIYDAQALQSTQEDVESTLREKKPKLIIFSTSTTTIYKDLEIAKIAKAISKDICTICFGTHIQFFPKETLQMEASLDVAIFSEPESVVPELVKNNLDLIRIKGIAYRKNGEIVINEPHLLCKNRDELGFPAHDKIPFHLYRDPHMVRSPLSMTLAQQGCINSCMYCVCPTFYGKLNQRTPDHVYQELSWATELGIKEMRFFDSGLTHDLDWVNKLLDRLIERKLSLSWVCNVRADRFEYNLAKKMREAGCHTVGIGCESADEYILRNVSKNIIPELVIESVKNAKKAKLKTLVYFIFGLPGETTGTLRKTIDFAKRLGSDLVTFNIANPQPGTRFYKYLIERNYVSTFNWEEYDPNKKPVFNYPNLSSQEIFDTMKRAYKEYYLRPRYILKKLFDTRSLLNMKNNIKNLIGFVRRYGF